MKVLLRNLFVFCALAFGLIGFTGCETLQEKNNPAVPATEPPPTAGQSSDIIRVGEQLTIEFFETNLGKIEQPVADDGTITLPLLPERVAAGGKKVSELQDNLRNLYVPRYFHRMTVNIKRENRYYWVRGEVKRPGQLNYTGDMTLTKAISAAGDFTEYADRKNIEIIRGNGVKTKVKWKDALKNPSRYDLAIYPGDTVHVPQSWK
jgi:protein involved in polysaccharide export with SLBB domain